MLLDDLRHVLHPDPAVPDALRVDDDRRSVRAGIETSGGVRADHALQPAALQLVLQRRAHRLAALARAAPARIVLRPTVLADEDVVAEAAHARSIAWRGRPRHPRFGPRHGRPARAARTERIVRRSGSV